MVQSRHSYCAPNSPAFGVSSAFPYGLTTGPDGNLWIADSGPFPSIEVPPVAGAEVFKPGTGQVAAFGADNGSPLNIAAGPDGNLWFTDQGTFGVGRFTTSGKLTAFPSLVTATPTAITAGPDGNIWFQVQDFNANVGTLGKISTAGAFTPFQVPHTQFAEDMVAGPDGAFWIPESGFFDGNPAIAVVGLDGTLLDEVGTSYVGGAADGIAVGPDHRLWITLELGGRVSRMSAIHGSGDAISGTVGQNFSGSVASFVDGTPTAKPSDFTATIDWGDGKSSAGTVSGGTGGPFQVNGSHAFVQSGNLVMTITLHDTVDDEDYHTKGTAVVQPGLLPTSTSLISSLNPAPGGQPVTYTATVSSATPMLGGFVRFSEFGNVVLATTPLFSSSSSAIFSTNALPAGPHEISAEYLGDSSHEGSVSNTLNEIITTAGQSATTAGLVPSKTFVTGALEQRSVILMAAVTTGGATATGTVSFYAGARLLGTQPLDNTGSASLTTSELNVGANELTAAYSGDTNFAASISSVAVVYRSPKPR